MIRPITRQLLQGNPRLEVLYLYDMDLTELPHDLLLDLNQLKRLYVIVSVPFHRLF